MHLFHRHALSVHGTELLAGIMGKDIAQGVFLGSQDKEKTSQPQTERVSNLQRKVISLQVDLPSAKLESRRQ